MNPGRWPGPYWQEAEAGFHRAIGAGMNLARSLVVGSISSFRDCWMFQRLMAKRLGISVRTVQRALHQARELGLIECHRAKQGERAPGLGKPVECGWSHRWAIGWGMAKELARRAVDVARVKAMLPGAFGGRRKLPRQPERKRWTAEEIDAELARRLALAGPDEA
jgi:hypothetical protein